MQYYDLFPNKSNGIKLFYKRYIMLFIAEIKIHKLC